MNPKKEKLMAEKETLLVKIDKYGDRIEKMKNRITEIDSMVTSIVNSEYGEVMQVYNMSPEELAEFLEKYKKKGNDA